MFEVYCPSHGCSVLLTTSRIEALRNTPSGPEVVWRCWCGTRGHMHRGAGTSATTPGMARVIELLSARRPGARCDHPAEKAG
ncbi:MAG: hypothetical protein ACRDJ9_18730 [Dehalococcoidia bacterium]